MKTIDTHRFGPITLDPSKCFTFPEGVFGFSELRKFALVDHAEDDIFLYLQSIEDAGITFPLIDNKIDGEKRFFSIVTIQNDPTLMTANIKAPIMLDLATRQGYQVILKDPDLAIRTPVYEKIAAVTEQKKRFKLQSMNLDICQNVSYQTPIIFNQKTKGIDRNAPQNFHINAVLDYILDHELSDFEEWPSNTHVYFHAYACRFSGLSADMMLAQTIKELENQ